MPLYKVYTKKTTDSILADLVNISKEPGWGAGTAIAAAFLRGKTFLLRIESFKNIYIYFLHFKLTDSIFF